MEMKLDVNKSTRLKNVSADIGKCSSVLYKYCTHSLHIALVILISFGFASVTNAQDSYSYDMRKVERRFEMAGFTASQMNDIRAAVYSFYLENDNRFPDDLVALTDPTLRTFYTGGLVDSSHGMCEVTRCIVSPFSEIVFEGKAYAVGEEMPSPEAGSAETLMVTSAYFELKIDLAPITTQVGVAPRLAKYIASKVNADFPAVGSSTVIMRIGKPMMAHGAGLSVSAGETEVICEPKDTDCIETPGVADTYNIEGDLDMHNYDIYNVDELAANNISVAGALGFEVEADTNEINRGIFFNKTNVDGSTTAQFEVGVNWTPESISTSANPYFYFGKGEDPQTNSIFRVDAETGKGYLSTGDIDPATGKIKLNEIYTASHFDADNIAFINEANTFTKNQIIRSVGAADTLFDDSWLHIQDKRDQNGNLVAQAQSGISIGNDDNNKGLQVVYKSGATEIGSRAFIGLDSLTGGNADSALVGNAFAETSENPWIRFGQVKNADGSTGPQLKLHGDIVADGSLTGVDSMEINLLETGDLLITGDDLDFIVSDTSSDPDSEGNRGLAFEIDGGIRNLKKFEIGLDWKSGSQSATPDPYFYFGVGDNPEINSVFRVDANTGKGYLGDGYRPLQEIYTTAHFNIDNIAFKNEANIFTKSQVIQNTSSTGGQVANSWLYLQDKRDADGQPVANSKSGISIGSKEFSSPMGNAYKGLQLVYESDADEGKGRAYIGINALKSEDVNSHDLGGDRPFLDSDFAPTSGLNNAWISMGQSLNDAGQVSPETKLHGNVIVDAKSLFYADANFVSNLSVGQSVEVAQDITAENINARQWLRSKYINAEYSVRTNNLAVDNDANITNNLNIGGTLTVIGESRFNGKLSAHDVDITGDMEIAGLLSGTNASINFIDADRVSGLSNIGFDALRSSGTIDSGITFSSINNNAVTEQFELGLRWTPDPSSQNKSSYFYFGKGSNPSDNNFLRVDERGNGYLGDGNGLANNAIYTTANLNLANLAKKDETNIFAESQVIEVRRENTNQQKEAWLHIRTVESQNAQGPYETNAGISLGDGPGNEHLKLWYQRVKQDALGLPNTTAGYIGLNTSGDERPVLTPNRPWISFDQYEDNGAASPRLSFHGDIFAGKATFDDIDVANTISANNLEVSTSVTAAEIRAENISVSISLEVEEIASASGDVYQQLSSGADKFTANDFELRDYAGTHNSLKKVAEYIDSIIEDSDTTYESVFLNKAGRTQSLALNQIASGPICLNIAQSDFNKFTSFKVYSRKYSSQIHRDDSASDAYLVDYKNFSSDDYDYVTNVLDKPFLIGPGLYGKFEQNSACVGVAFVARRAVNGQPYGALYAILAKQ